MVRNYRKSGTHHWEKEQVKQRIYRVKHNNAGINNIEEDTWIELKNSVK